MIRIVAACSNEGKVDRNSRMSTMTCREEATTRYHWEEATPEAGRTMHSRSMAPSPLQLRLHLLRSGSR